MDEFYVPSLMELRDSYESPFLDSLFEFDYKKDGGENNV